MVDESGLLLTRGAQAQLLSLVKDDAVSHAESDG